MLHKYKPEIDAAWQEDVYNAPVLKTAAQYNAWKNNLIHTWCDEKTGFDVNPELLSLAAEERIASMLSLSSAQDNLNASEFFQAVDPKDIAPSTTSVGETRLRPGTGRTRDARKKKAPPPRNTLPGPDKSAMTPTRPTFSGARATRRAPTMSNTARHAP